MGAVEHLKTLCCLGLPPESAMVAVTPLLHEIIPHGWSRIVLLEPDGTFGHGYAENPETAAIFRERMWRFNDDPSSPAFLWTSSFHAVAIGWTLHMQGRGWLESGWYREIEAPLNSCWILDAMIGDAGRTFALAHLMLTRPRSARPLPRTTCSVSTGFVPGSRMSFVRNPPMNAALWMRIHLGIIGTAVRSGQMILMPDGTLVFQTPGIESLLRILAREPGNYTRDVIVRDRLPSPVLKLLPQIASAANGTSSTPPRRHIFNCLWRCHPRSQMASASGRDPRGCRQGPKELSYRGDD